VGGGVAGRDGNDAGRSLRNVACAAVRRSVLQRVAVRCSALQCLAVCCSSWQYAAMCCSMVTGRDGDDAGICLRVGEGIRNSSMSIRASQRVLEACCIFTYMSRTQ